MHLIFFLCLLEIKQHRKRRQPPPHSSTQPPPFLVLVAPLLQQLVEDAALFQGSEVIDVLGDDGHVTGLAVTRPPAAARPLGAAVLVVGQRAQQRVVFVGGEVIPGDGGGGRRVRRGSRGRPVAPPTLTPLHSLRLVPGGGVGQLHHVTR